MRAVGAAGEGVLAQGGSAAAPPWEDARLHHSAFNDASCSITAATRAAPTEACGKLPPPLVFSLQQIPSDSPDPQTTSSSEQPEVKYKHCQDSLVLEV